MKDKAVKMEMNGIKCDNPECDYKDDNVGGSTIKEIKEWLNKPCPKCGQSLLTQEDLNAIIQMKKVTDVVNTLCAGQESSDKKITISANMNGTGKMNFKLKD